MITESHRVKYILLLSEVQQPVKTRRIICNFIEFLIITNRTILSELIRAASLRYSDKSSLSRWASNFLYLHSVSMKNPRKTAFVLLAIKTRRNTRDVAGNV